MSPCAIMGIINLTPDSFSDGGTFYGASTATKEKLWARVGPWIDAGIHWIDLGAESTRPGSLGVDDEEEWRRLSWVLEFLDIKDLGLASLSIDSYHPRTQLAALDCSKVSMINCVRGVGNFEHLVSLRQKVPSLSYLAMHMHGETFAAMQDHPLEEDAVLAEVTKELKAYGSMLKLAGFSEEHIYLDCGIGFGKSVLANLKLLESAHKLASEMPMTYGLSRKSFLGKLLLLEKHERDSASKILEILLMRAGVKLIRTHSPLPLLHYRKSYS